MNLAEYSKKWDRDINNNFAVACYNDCSIDQLVAATEPDDADMQTWDISADEWKDAIETALTEKLEEDQMERKEMQEVLDEHRNRKAIVKSVKMLEKQGDDHLYQVDIQDDQVLYVIIGSTGGCLITDSHDDAYEQWHIS